MKLSPSNQKYDSHQKRVADNDAIYVCLQVELSPEKKGGRALRDKETDESVEKRLD